MDRHERPRRQRILPCRPRTLGSANHVSTTVKSTTISRTDGTRTARSRRRHLLSDQTQRTRRRTFVLRPLGRRSNVGCRRQRVHRLHPRHGAQHLRPRTRVRLQPSFRGHAQGLRLCRPVRARTRSRRDGRRCRAHNGLHSSICQFRHGDRPTRPEARKRLHRQNQIHKVRRPLPRVDGQRESLSPPANRRSRGSRFS